ncbi:MAG TPA: M23 family metallopeptidase [Polyangia bacterium]|nr:M23 family metallopeptidase [Polyangia bacterium]HWE31566.1 M23 family metallopeptidase [Polyangia bacterium]
MGDVIAGSTSARRCSQCGGSTHLRTPHVVIDGPMIRTFCSAECAAQAAHGEPATPLVPPEPARPPRRWARRLFNLSLGLPMLLYTSGRPLPPRPTALAASATRADATGTHVLSAAIPDPALVVYGPRWPPTDQDWLDEIAGDAWIHPLDGPNRRMPISDSRVFGAERAGDRPGECRNGHCGVDLSGPWGEPVHAVHDGVVDRVQRGPNDEHGGLYVRIAHRDGTIFSQYFHLAAIPRHLEPGVHVKVGEVIGLLGDSGVKHSAPHLHFALSVRPAANATEKYMDPEPLIALWPLRLPTGDTSGILTARAAPGVPHGAASRHPRHHAAAVAPGAADEGATSE